MVDGASLNMSILNTILAFLVALGSLILIHEYGHYLIARLCDVKILRFSMGFGKPLFLKKWGKDNTEWVIAAIPLGGYVKMLDEREGPVESTELHRAFNRKSVWQRFAIVSAGPIANFLLAIVLYWAIFLNGIPGLKPILAEVPDNTPAAQAKLSKGDEILSMDGESITSWQDVQWKLLQKISSASTVDFNVREENGQILIKSLHLDTLNSEDINGNFSKKLGLAPSRPLLKPIIGQLVPGETAERSGLQLGDKIIAINDSAVNSWQEAVSTIRLSFGKTINLKIERQGNLLVLEVPVQTIDENGQKIGRIGISPKLNDQSEQDKFFTVVQYKLGEGFIKAIQKTFDVSWLSLKMLGRMIIGDISWRNISGPVTIADYAGQSAQIGWLAYLDFLALISISLGVLNLLPIPLLDGGHLMYYIVEIIKGRPVSDKVMEMGQRIGLGLLYGLMALALYNDIYRLIAT